MFNETIKQDQRLSLKLVRVLVSMAFKNHFAWSPMDNYKKFFSLGKAEKIVPNYVLKAIPMMRNIWIISIENVFIRLNNYIFFIRGLN